MGYARFDDLYDDNPKIRRAWRVDPALVAIHAMAITHCSRHNNDGEIHADWVHEKLALLAYSSKQRAKVLEALLKLRLFEQIGDEHYYVHDYLDWNRSRDERQALAEQGRRGGKAKARSAATANGKPRLSDGQAMAKPTLSERSSTAVTTTETTTEKNYVEPDRLDADPRDLATSQRFYEHLRARDPKAKGDPRSKRWLDASRLLRTDDGRDPVQIDAVMAWLPTDDFWPTVVLSMPKFREKFTQLVAAMNRTPQSRPPNGVISTAAHQAQADAFIAAQQAAQEAEYARHQ